MTRYYVCEHQHTVNTVTYREYPSQYTAERACRVSQKAADRNGVPVSYRVVTDAETGLEVAG